MSRWILIAFAAAFFPSHANASSEIIQLTPGNQEQIGIKAEKTANGVRYTVTINESGPISPDYDYHGGLSVVDDDGKYIVSCKIEKTLNGKSICYEFEISSKYLNKSQFSFVSQPRGHPAFVDYWFYLKDYAPGK
jgi:hypothetical protein